MESSASDAAAIVQVDRTTLHQLIVKLLQRKGMFAAEGEIVADRMIEADQQHRFSEGTATLPEYLEAMDLGDIDPRARVITLTEAPAMAVFDGSTGMGHVAMTKAVTMAVEKASATGNATVVIKNSRPCGDLGGIARLAAKQGVFALITSSFDAVGLDPASHHDLAWASPAPAGADPLVQRQLSSNVDVAFSSLCGILSAGLAGADALPKKRKAVRVANSVDYFVMVINPEKIGTKEVFFTKWQSLWASLTPVPASELGTVPLRQDGARQLAELATKIKFPISW